MNQNDSGDAQSQFMKPMPFYASQRRNGRRSSTAGRHMKVINMNTLASKTIKSLAMAGLAACLVTGAANAQRASESFVFRFDYERAALNSDAGSKAVYQQLVAEARRACATDLRMTAYAKHRATEACTRNLVDQTVKSIKAPRLAAIHSGARPILLASR